MNAVFQPKPVGGHLPATIEAGGPPEARYGSPYPGLGDFGFGETQSRSRLALMRVLDLVLKHKLLIAVILALAVLGGAVKTYLTTPLYEATTTIQIDAQAPRVLNKRDGGGGGDEGGREPFFFETQFQLLKSRSLAERVANSIDLTSLPESKAGRGSMWSRLSALLFGDEPARADAKPLSAVAIADRRVGIAGMIMGGLSIQPVPMSRIVRIAFTSPDAALAQKVSIAVADNFVASTLDRRFNASAYARQFFEERIQQVKAKLEDSEKQVVAYARKEGIVNTDDKQPETAVRLAAMTTALAAATAERIRNEQLWAQAQASNGLSLPQVMNDRAVQTARDKRGQLMAEYQDKLNLLKPAFPEMVQLKSEISELDHQVRDQIDLVRESIHSQYDASKAQQASLEKTIADLRIQSLDLRSRSIEYNILQRELDTNKGLYEGLLQQYKELGVAASLGTNNVTIVDRAEFPTAPVSPRLPRNLTFAFLIGIAAAMSAIYVLELLDDTFKGAETVEEALSITTLGVIPLASTTKRDLLDEIMKTPTSAVAEAYRSLRTALQFSTEVGTPRVLLVTSARPGEGKSTTSVSLASNFAQLGLSVLLVDADLRNPSLSRYLDCPNDFGLSNLLAGASSAEEVIKSCLIERVSLMTSGPLPPNPAELLAGPRMPAMLAEAGENFDLVIIDGPPVMGLADAPLLSSLAVGTLMVIQSGMTRRGLVQAALKRLRFARARVVGVVLSKFDASKLGYAYGYGYGYGYYGSKPEEGRTPKLPKSSDA